MLRHCPRRFAELIMQARDIPLDRYGSAPFCLSTASVKVNRSTLVSSRNLYWLEFRSAINHKDPVRSRLPEWHYYRWRMNGASVTEICRDRDKLRSLTRNAR